MDPLQYYSTTLSNAFGKLLPTLGYLFFAYLVFIKLPFYLLLKIKKDHTRTEELKPEGLSAAPVDLKLFKKKVMVEEEAQKQQTQQKAESSKGHERKERPKEKKQERNEQRRKETIKPKKPILTLAEEIFELSPGQVLSKPELKKRYHDLLRKNHPDKVDSLGSEFKKLAEQKTKDINQAYQRLKSKAS